MVGVEQAVPRTLQQDQMQARALLRITLPSVMTSAKRTRSTMSVTAMTIICGTTPVGPYLPRRSGQRAGCEHQRHAGYFKDHSRKKNQLA